MVAADIRKDGAVVKDSAVAANSDRNVVAVHHVKNIVGVIHSVTSIGPGICIDRNSLKPRVLRPYILSSFHGGRKVQKAIDELIREWI